MGRPAFDNRQFLAAVFWILLTQGTTADCAQAIELIDGIEAEHLLADRGYDSNEIVVGASAQGMNPVIPSQRNRKKPREYDRHPYKLRRLVENAFLDIKQWRGVAPRYAKRTASYLAICQVGAMVIRSKPFWTTLPSL